MRRDCTKNSDKSNTESKKKVKGDPSMITKLSTDEEAHYAKLK